MLDLRARTGVDYALSPVTKHPVFGLPSFADAQLTGIVDDVRMWPYVPTDEDVLARARRELDAEEAAETVLYLAFKEGTGAIAYDSSPEGNDAALVGPTKQWVGFEGTPDLAGTRKPRVWGVRRMRKGVLEDPQRLVYRLNLGPTENIIPLENGFASLVYDGDFPDIYDWTSAPGHYATQLSAGRARLHEALSGLAFDVWGDVDPVGGYTEATAQIMRNIAVRDGGLSAIDGIDDVAVSLAVDARPDAVGISTGTEPVSIMSVLNDLGTGADIWWTMLRSSKFTMGVREDPGVPEFDLNEDSIVDGGLECVATSTPVRQWTLSCREQEVVLALEDVAGAVPEEERPRFTKEVVYAQSPDLGAEFAKRHRDARYATGRTLYDDVAACRREAVRRLAIDRYRHDVYRAALPRGVFQYRVGQPGRLTFPRFLLGGGNLYVIGGHEEATETGAVALYLWGRSI